MKDTCDIQKLLLNISLSYNCILYPVVIIALRENNSSDKLIRSNAINSIAEFIWEARSTLMLDNDVQFV